MSFDKPTRNALASMVGDCRRLLTADIRDQLQGVYGLQPDGTALPVLALRHLDDRGRDIAQRIRDWREQLASLEVGPEEKRRANAFDRLARETAFTVLNRLAALRMCEERGHIVECVRRGRESDGFLLFDRLSGGALGDRGQTYRLFLERMFDELAVDLGVLFDVETPQSLVFPGERCLDEVFRLLNEEGLSKLWPLDETVGWIYQYFNSKEEREALRKASSAPRNSRELAVRNQFFTPRYVVEFLTDNTIGRIWYEMNQGHTRLKDDCRYLVRRPKETFLKHGEIPSTESQEPVDMSQEELLKEPVDVSFRPTKDPRDLKILDPACGSGHFLLYAFDLLETIYEEAWAAEKAARSAVTGKTLKDDYSTLEELRRAIPDLILRHNLHGIDIDPRACQIAALALWLRAQRTFQRLGLKGAARPRITKTNIVCAEPMPGERDMLRQFVADLRPVVLGQLVEGVFDSMTLAGEAGSLLRVEEDLRGAIRRAKQQWTSQPKDDQLALWVEEKRPKAEQIKLFDLSGISDEQFWDGAEARVLKALGDYAEQASNGQVFRRKLFSDDASAGFAFIDISFKRYDAILMNPPFGEAAIASKGYLEDHFEHSARNIFQAFVERGLECLSAHGRVGVISSRTGFFLGDSSDWRVHVVFRNRVICFADLGLGVLDDALVEVAAYVVEQGDPVGNRIYTSRQLDTRDKGERLLKAVEATHHGDGNGFLPFEQSLLQTIPDQTFAYWAPARLLRRYSAGTGFGTLIGKVRQGVASADDFRFARLGWEVSNSSIGRGRRWQRFSKGGEYSPPYDDIHLLVDWGLDGEQLKAFPGSRFQNDKFYFKPGATYSVRTASAFAGKVLPPDCVFSHMAQSWFPESASLALLSIGYLSARVPQTFVELAVGSGDIVTAGSAARRYTTAVVESVPARPFSTIQSQDNLEAVQVLYRFRLSEFMADETSCHFSTLHLTAETQSLRRANAKSNKQFLGLAVEALAASGRLDQAVCKAFQLTEEEFRFVEKEVGVHPTEYTGSATSEVVLKLLHLPEERLMSEAVENHGSKRWFTKKSYFVDRRLEIICHYLKASPTTIERLVGEHPLDLGLEDLTQCVLSEAVGCAFGRWDVRFATGEKSAPSPHPPFEPLPICAPAMLQNAQGLPLPEDELRRFEVENERRYPLDLPLDGIDDADSTIDIVRRVRVVLSLVWKDRTSALEEEACEILCVKDLREYLRKPALFFGDHLRRYSKSRRQAPIYWPLSTASGSYTIWLYYHRLTEDSLHTAVNKCLNPKIADLKRLVFQLETELPHVQGREAMQTRERLETAEAFLRELSDLREKLLCVASLPYKPNLNDGVLITAAPLWELFRLPKWRKDLEQCRNELEAGEYDWAHMAHAIWPERVQEKCKTHRSIAIALGLENLYQGQPKQENTSKRKRPSKQKGKELSTNA